MSATGSANDRNEFLRSLRNGAIIGALVLVVAVPWIRDRQAPPPPAVPTVAPPASAPRAARPLADFGDEMPSQEARHVANWAFFTGFTDEIHHQECELLTVTTAHANAFLWAILEAIDFGTLDMVNHGHFDFNAIKVRGSDQKIFAVCHEQHTLETKLFAFFNRQAIHFNGSPFDDTVLLAATINNRISHFLFSPVITSPCTCGVLTLIACERGSWGVRSNSLSDSYC